MMSGISEAISMDIGSPSGWGASSPGMGAGMSPGAGMSASPVASLMNAMEAKWMSGSMMAIPRAISKAIHVPARNNRQQPVS